MKNNIKNILIVFVLLGMVPIYAGGNDSYKDLSLENFTEGWFDDWEHNHYSKSQAPFVHLFHLEPAFLDRDLFLDYKINNGQEEKEIEYEFELEWALTSRIGLVLEGPYRILEEQGEDRVRGFGDLGLATRFLLLRDSDSMLSLNVGMEFPTGSKSKGLSEDELVVNTSFSYWQSFGKKVTWNAQLGMEQGLETEEKTITYGTALTYSLNSAVTHDHTGNAHNHQGVHFPQGMTNFMLEYSGRNS
ncbi:hypothetical protein PQO01_05335 [Lentisphaera marina]|uniref:hypothetical protein n=1 Tax=Lentisphaera marina TaxID=1111041 RepID=UPI002365EA1A|nr:hypothetical protein [Lentisphaera marina]MDD7984369.1 hypothetical protein [Lentisphaera marina]